MTEIIIQQLSAEEQEYLDNLDVVAAERQYKSVEDMRKVCYQRDADPLFFGFQRGDNSKQDWLDAVQAVKDANPYPVKAK